MASKKSAAPVKKAYVIVYIDDDEVVDYDSDVFHDLNVAKQTLANICDKGWVIAEIQFESKVTVKTEVVPFNA